MKKYLLLAAIVAAMGTGSILGYRSMSKAQNLSDTQLANIEALDEDPEQKPCNNFNGYRRILEGNEKIYDCCFKEQVGKGKDDCKRW